MEGIIKRKYVLAGEESAGMSVSGWTPEKDGILAVCLLMEIMAVEGGTPVFIPFAEVND